MDHNAIRHMLSEYIDGTINAQDKAEIEEHLKTCRKCSDALNELKKTVEHVKTVEEVDPPAWMTRKIMAKVRAKAEKEKGIFQKLFFPLSVKLPIQAVAVAFLAVTAFYIYQNIQPAAKFAEAPADGFKAKGGPPASSVIARGGQNKTQDSSFQSKQIPQTPEYKALDMKQEYEMPSPPVPEAKAAAPAPAPAKPAEQLVPAKKEQGLAKSQETPAFAGKREQAAQAQDFAAMGKAKQEVHPHAVRAKTAESTEKEELPANIIITVKDFESAEKEIDKALAQSGGEIIKREPLKNMKILTATIAADRIKKFVERLKAIGDIKENWPSAMNYDSVIDIRIELIQR